MTVGNLTERLINDSANALDTGGFSIVNNNCSNNLNSINNLTAPNSIQTNCLDNEEPITSMNTELPSNKSSSNAINTNHISNTTNITTTTNNSTSSHSLGYLKKMRSHPKTGRNHAGAKYLASQYTKGISY